VQIEDNKLVKAGTRNIQISPAALWIEGFR